MKIRQISDHVEVPFVGIGQTESKVGKFMSYEEAYLQHNILLFLDDFHTLFGNTMILLAIGTEARLILMQTILE